jgi:5-methylcytosine-specific restriction protein A
MEKPKSKPRPWAGKPRTEAPMGDRSRDPFYHTNRWRKESRAFLQEHPICVKCREKGLTVPARATDHIIPKSICRDPWDRTNWQPLCTKCNNLKGAQDKKLIKKTSK